MIHEKTGRVIDITAIPDPHPSRPCYKYRMGIGHSLVDKELMRKNMDPRPKFQAASRNNEVLSQPEIDRLLQELMR